ncbi:hypothetical protein FNV43_RR17069 [Rhamnella rubrinervis]|uniref:Uncharacterized protein n=1 Tax=Rhamnella rubrinervis TaxID=2594499 RepID=A0A8K0H036_9ROSA|nr:hypothetical protein FNV43_RR17069 [Rhamnella rubrinervis]
MGIWWACVDTAIEGHDTCAAKCMGSQFSFLGILLYGQIDIWEPYDTGKNVFGTYKLEHMGMHCNRGGGLSVASCGKAQGHSACHKASMNLTWTKLVV